MKRYIVTVLLLYVAQSGLSQDTLFLKDAIALCMENNYGIAIAINQREIAFNNNTWGNAGVLPDVTAGGSYSRTRENTELIFTVGDPQNRTGAVSSVLDAAIEATWGLELSMLFTKDQLTDLAIREGKEAEVVIQNTVADVSISYYTLILEKKRLELLENNLNLTKTRFDLAESRYQLGKGSKLDFLQANVDYNTDQSTLLRQKEAVQSARINLNRLMVVPLNSEHLVGTAIKPDPDLQFEQLRTVMLSQNPSILASFYQEQAAAKQIEIEEAQFLPQIQFNVGGIYAQSEAEAGFVESRSSLGLTYGVSAAWNLFNGFNRTRNIENAKLEELIAGNSYEQLKLELESQLLNVFINYQNNLELLQLEEKSLGIASENAEIAMERYKIGRFSELELREAQLNALDAEIRYLQASYNAKIAEIGLLRLSGGILN